MSSESKHVWEPMQLVSVGSVAEVVKGGGGKLTAAGGDPGEQRKESGTG
jgi:hypothetical protein